MTNLKPNYNNNNVQASPTHKNKCKYPQQNIDKVYSGMIKEDNSLLDIISSIQVYLRVTDINCSKLEN